jgi:hypothetical protein
MARFLTGQVDTQIVDRDELVAIFRLRDLTPRLTKNERAALTVLLVEAFYTTISTCTPIGRLVDIIALQAFTTDLTNAALQISALSPTTKGAIAIELLNQIQCKNENIEED